MMFRQAFLPVVLLFAVPLSAESVLPTIASDLEIQGVFTTSTGLGAVVNGRVVAAGDWLRVEGYEASVRILKIEPNGVEFEYLEIIFRKAFEN